MVPHGPHATETASPGGPWRSSWGAFFKKLPIYEVSEGSWGVLGGPFGVRGVRGGPGRGRGGPREVPGGPGGALGKGHFLLF